MAFAKLFETSKGQVLVIKQWNDQKNYYEVVRWIEREEMIIRLTLTFQHQKDSDKFFEKQNQQEAESFIAKVFAGFEYKP